jgi:hypothetical protein
LLQISSLVTSQQLTKGNAQGEDIGTVDSQWLADNFVMGYVKLDIVKNVMEEALLHE